MHIQNRIRHFFTDEGSQVANVVVFLLYICAVVSAVVYHEPWMDEAQAWLLAVGVNHPGELLQYMKYEGSPMLWHTILWGAAKLGAPYAAIQYINACIMIGAAAVILFKTRLPFVLKVLVLTSYPLLYVYGAISRSYGLMTLLMLSAAALHESRLKKPIRYGIVLLLLSQVNFFGLLAAAFFAVMHLEATIRNTTSVTVSWIIGPFVGFACITAILLLLPSADVGQHLTTWHFTADMEQVYDLVQTITATFFPLPPYSTEYWNAIIFSTPVILLALISAVISFLSVRWSRFAAGMYICIGGGIYTFLLIKGLRRVRFFEAIIIVFIMAVIIMYNQYRSRTDNMLPARTSVFIACVLLLQFIPNIVAVRFDATESFSYSREIAQVINNTWETESEIWSYPQTAALSTFAHVVDTKDGLNTYYALDVEQDQVFALWSQAYYDSGLLSQQTIDDRIIQKIDIRTSTDSVFLLVQEELSNPQVLERFTLLHAYNDAIVDTERLYVYVSQ